MKVGLYPGSFNPWHAGHTDILEKALKVFDYVYVLVMSNENKGPHGNELLTRQGPIRKSIEKIDSRKASTETHKGTLKDAIEDIKVIAQNQFLCRFEDFDYAIIRGLRNGTDLQYEMNNQYWNEDVGITIPFVYFITDRSLAHVSSSSIRSINKLGLEHNY